MKDTNIAILAAVGLILVVLAAPFATIAAINTLFSLNIAYNFWTWLSVCWMNLTTFGGLGLSIRSLKQK